MWPEARTFYLSSTVCLYLSRPNAHSICSLCSSSGSDSRSLLTASYRSLLRTYVLSQRNDQPSQALLTLLSSPRVRLIELSCLDDASGTTLLHEATRRKDLRLIELAVRAGADVFVRDRKGRPVQEVAGKDDKMRVFLRQCEYNPLFLSFCVLIHCSRE